MDTEAQPGYLLINRLFCKFFTSRVYPIKMLIAQMQILIAADDAGRSTLLNAPQPAYGN